ncbi:hypothetical protein, partial [Atlantibacter hermannii]|uniref:hypothetical protein n=1 Tax=Atlantibacter hermannii TaxID=565 RepID=UPI0028AC990C
MMFALGGGACFVGWYCSVRLAGGAFLGFVELIRSPDWRGFFVFVELFRSLRAAGALFVGWICSVRFGLRCASIVTGERDRVGGARRRAP